VIRERGVLKLIFLMIVAANRAAFIDSWGEGGPYVVLFSLGHAFRTLCDEQGPPKIH